MRKLLKSILKKENKKIKQLCERYPQYQIGKHTYGHPKILSWGEGTQIKIGAYCSFAGGIKIFLGGEHRTDWVTTYPFTELWESAKSIKGHPGTKGDVVIGNDVWVGEDATIMSGVMIGDGAVIGSCAVVTKDVPPYGIVAGNPAKLVKKRFDDETIDRLLEIRWWDWDEEAIEKYLPLLLSNDIALFLDKATEVKGKRGKN